METIFDLEVVKAELEKTEWEDDPSDSDRQIRMVYLGSVQNLYPSGKIYMPWACSNLEPCPVCGGEGKLDNPTADYALFKMFEDATHGMRGAAMKAYGPYVAKGWPTPLVEALDYMQLRLNKYQQHVMCDTCDGIGSEEAAKDDRWRDQVERELDSIGAFLTSGEGSMDDLYAAQSQERSEVEEAV